MHREFEFARKLQMPLALRWKQLVLFDRGNWGGMGQRMARNVLGSDLIPCSMDPLTGFFRTGLCDTCGDDGGQHTVCAQMTEKFLEFSKSQGNDLTMPMPDFHFPGLKAGDFWCLCRGRWEEAHEAGVAPKVRLEATHASVLEYIDLDILKSYAV